MHDVVGMGGHTHHNYPTDGRQVANQLDKNEFSRVWEHVHHRLQ